MCWWRRGSRLLVVIAMLAPAATRAQEIVESSPPKIYKWVDENGIAHYTTDPERIPQALRQSVGGIEETSAAPHHEPSAPGPRSPESWASRDRVPEVNRSPGASGGFAQDAAVRRAQLAARRAELDEQIAALQADIASQEEALKALITEPAVPEAGPVAEPGFREIAERLPELLADLRALEDERAQLEEP